MWCFFLKGLLKAILCSLMMLEMQNSWFQFLKMHSIDTALPKHLVSCFGLLKRQANANKAHWRVFITHIQCMCGCVPLLTLDRGITVQGSASRILPLHTIITRHGFPNPPLYAPIALPRPSVPTNCHPRSRSAFAAVPLTHLPPATV